MSLLKDEVVRAKSRNEILGVMPIRSGKHGNFHAGHGRIATKPMKRFMVTGKKLEEYRKMAREKLAEAIRCNAYYFSNYR